ncbi:hypothetical protein F5878DRAFT_667275 [Lentinula raphanica]|uniref:Ras GEF n=1 Tax=Lentinula raphanica TaxID=153919 RepID=A0AA38NW37_9AGAR|nr:hypothetical protein F5878DRAFT_667275 [Lentinula raphanica]
MPPSPRRKGSTGSEMEATAVPPVPSRGGFPFSSSSRTLLPDSSSSSTSARSGGLLAPPNIIEPSPDPVSPKRSSQIKPFKLELKGSKLYIYKPPSDRAAAVKELFPTELVPASQQDEEENGSSGSGGGIEVEDDPFAAAASSHSRMDMRSTRQDNSLAQRKKRAFWGRRTHPDLSRGSDGRIEKGTFEALTHEAVFGTTFFGPPPEGETNSAAEMGSAAGGNEKAQIEPMEQWKDFAASVLLYEKKALEKQRVGWLVGEYLRFHGRPLEFPDWPEWKTEIAPEANASIVPLPVMPLPRSSSMIQAVFNPTPVASPNIGMFSPKPEENNTLSLFDALGDNKREELNSSSHYRLQPNLAVKAYTNLFTGLNLIISRLTSSSTAPHLPHLFPEPLPTVTLLDRAQFLRGRVDSDSTDFQHLRAVDGHLRPEGRKPLQVDSAFATLNQGGTTIPLYDRDTSDRSRPPSLVRSRPPSTDIDSLSELDGKSNKPIGRTPSIRVKPGSSASSVARRSSLPSLSQRQPLTLSENSSEPPLRVVVQAGTLDRLVDVLVHGLHNVSVSVADDNGGMSLRVRMTRELLLDHKEFTRVWWNVFRSVVTPLIFFELIRKIYIKSQPVGSPPLPDQYLTAIASRSRVLDALKLWLTKGGGAQDVLDDSQLLHAFQTFFASSSDHLIHSSASTFEDPSVRQAWDNLADSRKTLEQLLRSQTMRPSSTRTQAIPRNTVITTESRVRNLSTKEPPDLDRVSAEEFVDNIDGMAFAAFNNVTEETHDSQDLYITSDLLEVQSTDRTGWFPPREAPSLDEYIEIQTIHSHIQDVEPSSLIFELSPESLYRLLPPGIRSCIRAHSIIRKWLISKSVAPRIGLRARQARLEFLLQVIEVARMRNTEIHSPNSVSEQPCVRSLVEATLPVKVAAMTHFNNCSRDPRHNLSHCNPLTVDMGWLIVRILDIIAMPDAVESQNGEGQNLVNFDKRRNLCNFISNAPSLLSRRLAHQNEINRRSFERLNNVEREIFSLQFDIRGIK